MSEAKVLLSFAARAGSRFFGPFGTQNDSDGITPS